MATETERVIAVYVALLNVTALTLYVVIRKDTWPVRSLVPAILKVFPRNTSKESA